MNFEVITLKFLIVINNYTNKHKEKLSPKYAIYVVSGLPKSKFPALTLFSPFLLLIYNLSHLLYY